MCTTHPHMMHVHLSTTHPHMVHVHLSTTTPTHVYFSTTQTHMVHVYLSKCWNIHSFLHGNMHAYFSACMRWSMYACFTLCTSTSHYAHTYANNLFLYLFIFVNIFHCSKFDYYVEIVIYYNVHIFQYINSNQACSLCMPNSPLYTLSHFVWLDKA